MNESTDHEGCRGLFCIFIDYCLEDDQGDEPAFKVGSHWRCSSFRIDESPRSHTPNSESWRANPDPSAAPGVLRQVTGPESSTGIHGSLPLSSSVRSGYAVYVYLPGRGYAGHGRCLMIAVSATIVDGEL